MSNKVESEVVYSKHVSDNDFQSIDNKNNLKSPEIINEINLKK